MKLYLVIIAINAVYFVNAYEDNGDRLACVDSHPLCPYLCSRRCAKTKSMEKVGYTPDATNSRKKRHFGGGLRAGVGGNIGARIGGGGMQVGVGGLGVNLGLGGIGIGIGGRGGGRSHHGSGAKRPRPQKPYPSNSPDNANCDDLRDATRVVIDALCPRSCQSCGKYAANDYPYVGEKWTTAYCGDDNKPVGLSVDGN